MGEVWVGGSVFQALLVVVSIFSGRLGGGEVEVGEVEVQKGPFCAPSAPGARKCVQH